MNQKKQLISVRSMDAQTSLGIEFNYLEIKDGYNDHILKNNIDEVHRDDYYIFFFLETGEGLFSIDFDEIELTRNSVLYIRPGQVHFAVSKPKGKGWFLAIDSVLVETDYRNVFDHQFSTQRPIILTVPLVEKMKGASNLLLAAMQAKKTAFSNSIISNMANVFIGIIAEQYTEQQVDLQHKKYRSAEIAHRFKEALSNHYETIKSPTGYAKLLNYSLSHLNESVKNITGFPVSYWIHQQIILEAKRLLYYTDMSVKEIAFVLGYEDHTYFSRLFSKSTGVAPGAFRRRIHE